MEEEPLDVSAIEDTSMEIPLTGAWCGTPAIMRHMSDEDMRRATQRMDERAKQSPNPPPPAGNVDSFGNLKETP